MCRKGEVFTEKGAIARPTKGIFIVNKIQKQKGTVKKLIVSGYGV
jgi:hypothetical protein